MDREKFQGKYEVSDGYVGGSRPKYFSVFADDLEDDMTDDALENLYEESAYEHFLGNVNCDTYRKDEFIAWAKEVIKNRGNENE